MFLQYIDFYKEYKDKLFSYLMFKSGDFELSKEVVQESFTRHYQHYGRTSVISPSLLFTIARNALTDHFRYQKRSYNTVHPTHPAVMVDGEQRHIIKEECEEVIKAVKQLPEIDREILIMAVGGMPYREIAETLQLSEASIKVKVHRARAKLRLILDR